MGHLNSCQWPLAGPPDPARDEMREMYTRTIVSDRHFLFSIAYSEKPGCTAWLAGAISRKREEGA